LKILINCKRKADVNDWDLYISLLGSQTMAFFPDIGNYKGLILL